MMLLMMHQPHLHQPWRLDRCNPFILSGTLCWSALLCRVCGIGTALFSPVENTMQLFMWQRDIVGVAHYVMDCFEVLGALDDAPDDASISPTSALAAA